jgi:hypothetical protein
MLFSRALSLFPQTFDQLVPLEMRLLVAVVVLLLLRHTYGLICFVLGVPENWLVLLIKILAKRF